MNIKKPESVWEYNKSGFIPKFLPMSYQVLLNRGYSMDEINSFLATKELGFNDPYDLSGMKEAVEIIKDAITKKEKIVVYGDYDVDGITSTALLTHFFKMIDYEVDWYIPDRIKEGYGLSEESIKTLAKKYDLIITVDCGITANKEVDIIREFGSKVIITDHHQCADKLPNANAIINPHLNDDYDTPFLAGVGVSLKLVQGIAKDFKLTNINWDLLYALCAIGTIADIVPLLKENRLVTKLGIDALNNKKLLIGLDSLIKVSGIDKGSINTGNIAFGLAPRLNAGGRLGSAADPLKLLLTNSHDEAFQLAEHLNIQNEKRKAIEQKILSQAVDMLDQSSIYVLYHPEWHHGVLGIVASRIVELTHKPVILLGKSDDVIKGSGRSVKGVHLQKLLLDNDDILISHGGHELAAGLSLNEENLSKLIERLETVVSKLYDIRDFKPVLPIDLVSDVASLTYDNAKELESLSPFGYGNPQPNLLLNAVEVVDMQTISQGKHTKLVVKDFLDAVECLKWNENDIDVNVGDKIDILGNVSKNEWRNIKSASLIIKDYKASQKPDVIDQRSNDKTNYLKSLDDNYIIAVFNNIEPFNIRAKISNMFEPIFIHKEDEYYQVDDLKNIETKQMIVYDLPFFANQLIKLPFSKHKKLVLLYNNEDYVQTHKILKMLAIDRDYLLKIYQGITSKNGIGIEDNYFIEDNIKKAVSNHKLYYAIKILSEIDLLKFEVTNSTVKLMTNNKKVSLEDSTNYQNHEKLINRALNETKFLANASFEKIKEYVRRI